eukprot:1946767-Pleurochrysis_carterae.AAC.1
MKDVAIREEWTRFVDANAWLFRDDKKAAWMSKLRKVEQFIEESGGEELPSLQADDAYERSLAHW